MSDYLDANGVRMHYEIRGAGDDLVLMHGGMASNEHLSALAGELASSFRVILPERRGHGRTADVAGPMTYGVMADDMLAFLDALGIETAILAGHSDGANIGMLLAMRAPERVRALIAISGNTHTNGMAEEFLAFVRASDADAMAAAAPEIVETYSRLSPDGRAHFAVIYEKVRRLWLEEPRLTPADLAAITPPTLVVGADRDIILLEHLIATQRSVAAGDLCIVPGTTHDLVNEKPALIAHILRDWLAGV